MGEWNVRYPFIIRVVLYEFKRAMLGEIIDDLGINEYLYDKLGLEFLEWSPFDEGQEE